MAALEAQIFFCLSNFLTSFIQTLITYYVRQSEEEHIFLLKFAPPAVWPDLEKFCQLGKKLKLLAIFE